MKTLKSIKLLLKEEHCGVVSIEFLIGIIAFALAVFAVSQSPLIDRLEDKITEITNYITNNNM